MKKTLSMLLAGTMLASTMPLVSASRFDDFVDKLEEAQDKGEAIHFNVDVGANIKLKESGTYKDGGGKVIEVKKKTLPATIDYQAILSMRDVKDEFDAYIDFAEEHIGTDGKLSTDDQEKLDAVKVSGTFNVKIEKESDMIITADNKSWINGNYELKDFNAEAQEMFSEVERKIEGENVLTVTIKVDKDGKGYATKAELDEYFDGVKDLVMTCEDGIEVNQFDTEYTIKGWVNGKTELTADDGRKITEINYTAKENNNPEITETVKIVEGEEDENRRPVPGGGGGSSTSTITVKTEVDGSQVDKKTSSEDITYNPYDLDVPDKDNNLFAGWVDKATDEELDGNDKTFTKSTTIVATWIPTGINIDFVIDGTAVPANAKKATSVTVPDSAIDVGEEGTIIKTTDFEAVVTADRKFEGWFLDAEYTIPVEASMTVTEDTTFYGKTKKLDGSDVLDMDHHYAYIIGYPDGYVRPEQNISREEVATIFFRLLTEEARNSLLKKTNDFSDVDSARWSNTAISTMANYGTIVGYEDGTFRPEKAITRAEFVAMTARFYDLEKAEASFTDISGHWAEEYIESAVAKGWISGYEDGTFKPDQNITRAEAMTIVNHLLNRKVDAEGLHADAVQWDDNTSDKWYYYEVLEATNTHNCEERAEGVIVEKWTECLENFDWASIEL